MIIRCQRERDIERILTYIGQDYLDTPYLYIDLKQYGIGNEQIKVWLDLEADRIEGAYLQYYDCLHFYTRETGEYPAERFLAFTKELCPRVIMISGGFGAAAEALLSEKYDVERNCILDLRITENAAKDSRVRIASRGDLREIAELMAVDETFKNVYQKECLLAQLESRYDDGFSRFFTIREDERIVAVYSTYGEVEGIAVLSGLLVHPAYRHRGLAEAVMRDAFYTLSREKFIGLSFVNQENYPSIELHKKVGARFYNMMYKYIRKAP